MKNIFIEKELCKKDGLCAAICPLEIIISPGPDRLPEPVPDFHKWCISCGHCVSICPTGALSHSGIPADQCIPVTDNLLPAPGQFEYILRRRRSVRRFKEQAPSGKIIRQLISMSVYAPSGHNRQPVRWIVFNRKEDMHRLTSLVTEWMGHEMEQKSNPALLPLFTKVIRAREKGHDLLLHHAPCVILAHSDSVTGTETADCTIALAYADLAAISLGMGCCWCGLLTTAAEKWEPLRDFIKLPEGHRVHGSMLVGYPRHRLRRLPMRKDPVISMI
jgi:nitroreductase/NAD-dependent dihydropyrimidine dehydrogenase PreA subunit